MPNIAENHITLTKKQDAIIKSLADEYKKENKVKDNFVFNFDMLKPMPETLKNTISPESADMLDVAILQFKKDNIFEKTDEVFIEELIKKYNSTHTFSSFKLAHVSEILKENMSKLEYETKILNMAKRLFKIYGNNDMHKIYSVEEMIQVCKELLINLTKYNSASWYDWSSENWGTKWDVTYVERIDNDDKIEYAFDTAWALPKPIYNLLKEKIGEFEYQTVYENGEIEEGLWI